MAFIVVISNILVRFPINDWLTWGALSYPFSFLVTDLTNRWFGAGSARRVVVIGFAIGVVLSIFVDMRIALASGSAFFIAQMLDIELFRRISQRIWWHAPLASSMVATAVDTVLFFAIAFIGTGLPWASWAAGDFAVKILVTGAALVPYRLLAMRISG